MEGTHSNIGPYEILAEIGSGGMGIVYQARKPPLERLIALKVLPENLARNKQLVASFHREARIAAGLNHPNIVSIYEVSETAPYYIAMEWVEGETLEQLLARAGTLDPARAAWVLQQVASALDYAHARGVVHRDIKPSNILINRELDKIILTDFGIAQAAEATQHTRTGIVLGTPGYIAPERVKGETATPASDIYSLGIALFEMLTGVQPFRADTPFAVLHQQVTMPPPSPRKFNPQLPTKVEGVIRKALAKDPAQRYATAGELARDFALATDVQNPVSPTTVAPANRDSSSEATRPLAVGFDDKTQRTPASVAPVIKSLGQSPRQLQPHPAILAGAIVLVALIVVAAVAVGASSVWNLVSATPTAALSANANSANPVLTLSAARTLFPDQKNAAQFTPLSPPTATASVQNVPVAQFTLAPQATIQTTDTAAPTATVTPTLFSTETLSPSATPTRTLSPTRAPSKTATRRPRPAATVPPPLSGACANPEGQITSPRNNVRVKWGDVITVRGTASRTDYQYYKVQFQEEDSGDSWIQLFPVVPRAGRQPTSTPSPPVINGVLMEWYTQTVNPGTYLLRLLVVNHEGSWFDPPCTIRIIIDP